MTEKREKEAPTPFIGGDNINLIPFDEKHIKYFIKWVNNPKVRTNARNAIPMTIDAFKKMIKSKEAKEPKTSFYMIIWHKKDEKPIGDVGFNSIDWIDRKANVGLSIGEPEYWNQGIATEAAKLLLEYGFMELNLHKIYAGIFSPNIASIKAAKKAGFKEEAILKRSVYIDGKYYDEVMLSVFKEDWVKKLK